MPLHHIKTDHGRVSPKERPGLYIDGISSHHGVRRHPRLKINQIRFCHAVLEFCQSHARDFIGSWVLGGSWEYSNSTLILFLCLVRERAKGSSFLYSVRGPINQNEIIRDFWAISTLTWYQSGFFYPTFFWAWRMRKCLAGSSRNREPCRFPVLLPDFPFLRFPLILGHRASHPCVGFFWSWVSPFGIGRDRHRIDRDRGLSLIAIIFELGYSSFGVLHFSGFFHGRSILCCSGSISQTQWEELCLLGIRYADLHWRSGTAWLHRWVYCCPKQKWSRICYEAGYLEQVVLSCLVLSWIIGSIEPRLYSGLYSFTQAKQGPFSASL